MSVPLEYLGPGVRPDSSQGCSRVENPVWRTRLEKPPVFSGKGEDFHVWAKKVENFVSGMLPNVRGTAESQDVVTAAVIALGVPELDDETFVEKEEFFHSAVSPHRRSELRRFDVSRRRSKLRQLAQVAQKVGHGGTFPVFHMFPCFSIFFVIYVFCLLAALYVSLLCMLHVSSV